MIFLLLYGTYENSWESLEFDLCWGPNLLPVLEVLDLERTNPEIGRQKKKNNNWELKSFGTCHEINLPDSHIRRIALVCLHGFYILVFALQVMRIFRFPVNALHYINLWMWRKKTIEIFSRSIDWNVKHSVAIRQSAHHFYFLHNWWWLLLNRPMPFNLLNKKLFQEILRIPIHPRKKIPMPNEWIARSKIRVEVHKFADKFVFLFWCFHFHTECVVRLKYSHFQGKHTRNKFSQPNTCVIVIKRPICM